MPAYFDSGAFLRTPAWHRLGTVLDDWPGSWEEARKVAGLTWDVRTEPVMVGWAEPVLDNGYFAIMRDDMPATVDTELGVAVNPDARLAIQPESYAVITNRAFGEVIESIIGEIGEQFAFETLISIKGGRQIIALLRSREPLRIPGDFSQTFRYLAFFIRHDGQGGLRAIPTNIRIVCANTAQAAELAAKKIGTGWTIRHTANWESRLEDLKHAVAMSTRAGKLWENICIVLDSHKTTDDLNERFLDQVLPLSTDMSDRQKNSVLRSRDRVRQIWASPTCEQLDPTAYKTFMGWTEYVDHERRANGDDSRVTRSLLAPEPLKIRGLKLLQELTAG